MVGKKNKLKKITLLQHCLECVAAKLTESAHTRVARLWLRSNIHNATVVLSLLITQRVSERSPRPRVFTTTLAVLVAASTHCPSLHYFANGRHFSTDLTSLVFLF